MYWSRGSDKDLLGVLYRKMSYNTLRPSKSRILTVLTPHQRLAEGDLLREGVVGVCVVLVSVFEEIKVVLVVLAVAVVLMCVFEEVKEVLVVLGVFVAPMYIFQKADVELVIVVGYAGV